MAVKIVYSVSNIIIYCHFSDAMNKHEPYVMQESIRVLYQIFTISTTDTVCNEDRHYRNTHYS